MDSYWKPQYDLLAMTLQREEELTMEDHLAKVYEEHFQLCMYILYLYWKHYVKDPTP